MKILVATALIIYYVMSTLCVEGEKAKGGTFVSPATRNTSEVRRNHTTALDSRLKTVTQRKRTKTTQNKVVRGEAGCTSVGGICQPTRYICQGRYLRDKCSNGNAQCCVPDGAWSVLCEGHYNNRVRACDTYGCGAFNSRRGTKLHKAVDLVCGDYGIINAPFSGLLSGPVTHTDRSSGIQYDGVRLVGPKHCVKLFNVRPYRYMGSVTRGGAVGYLLPMQDSFSGITSHLKLQMCDGSDPTAFI